MRKVAKMEFIDEDDDDKDDGGDEDLREPKIGMKASREEFSREQAYKD